jgi:hypothetical protein
MLMFHSWRAAAQEINHAEMHPVTVHLDTRIPRQLCAKLEKSEQLLEWASCASNEHDPEREV